MQDERQRSGFREDHCRLCCPWGGSRHPLGSVNVLVQSENDSLPLMAMEFFSSRSVRTWKRSSAPRRSSSI